MSEKTINQLYNPNHFREVIAESGNLNALLNKSPDRDRNIRIGRRHAEVSESLRELDSIWRRFLSDRQKMLDVDFKTHRFIKNVNKTPKKLIILEQELSSSLKVDIKNLFIYSDIVLTKFVFLFREICGLSRGTKDSSATNFLKSIRKQEDISSAEHLLYWYLGEELEKTEVLIGLYRDYFITHTLHSYQQGLNRAVFLPDIRIDMSGELEKFDLNKFLTVCGTLKDILPDTDKFGRPLDMKSDPRPKVEVLFDNLHKIKDEKVYGKTVSMIRQIGIETPDVYKAMWFLKRTLNSYIHFLMWYLETRVLKISDKPLAKIGPS